VSRTKEKELADRIKTQVEHGESNHCFVGKWEINELWPEKRWQQIKLRRFARKHGFVLRGYEKGLGAVFVNAPTEK